MFKPSLSSKWCLRWVMLSMALAAGCVKSTPTPTSTSGAGGAAYPAIGPSATPAPESYPSLEGTPTPLPPTQPGGPYPAPTSGAAAQRVPL
jgi:hypothetical protein